MQSELVRSLRGQIVDRLRNDVLSGRIEPGQFLRQEDLVERFRVSRTPVREALIQLTNEGLLEAIPNTGVKVRHQPPDHIQQFLTPLRRTIEVYALELCFDSLNEADFQLWDSILEKLRTACQQRDYPGMAEYELALHRSILQRAGDSTLLSIWSSIVSQVAAYLREWHKKYADPLDNYREHKEIIDTFRTGDKDASIALYSEMIGAHHVVRQPIAKKAIANRVSAIQKVEGRVRSADSE
jgi:GntR family transcriptional regulator, rspAB operon transcriptional repressor